LLSCVSCILFPSHFPPFIPFSHLCIVQICFGRWCCVCFYISCGLSPAGHLVENSGRGKGENAVEKGVAWCLVLSSLWLLTMKNVCVVRVAAPAEFSLRLLFPTFPQPFAFPTPPPWALYSPFCMRVPLCICQSGT